AAYGQPRYVAQVYNLINPQEQGQYSLDMAYFDFVRGNQMYSPALCDLFGAPPRQPGAEITAFHCDVARSVQFVLEEILLDKVHYLASRVDSPNLCMAGGVALNCVANGRIVREGPFEKLFVQPAAGDAGGCLGAAALAHVHLTGERHSHMPLSHVYWGPAWTSEEVAAILLAAEIPADDFRQRQDRLLEKVVDGLESGQIVGWFQGAMEFGPRALGARSILSNPLLPGIRDRLNRLKGREMFRPFTPSVLAHHTAAHFDLDHLSLFMLETCPVRSPLALPGITHVDGSSRPQTVSAELNPRYAALLEAFYRRTGCPLLLNTSLNFRGEPIVCSPIDALLCMGRMGLDILVLNDFYIERTRLPDNWDVLCAGWQTQQQSAFTKHENMIHDYLYTFV
ncbi:MAG: carbamoyltransferase, partial [Chloroflexi bacterium]|nr:carbamoyltransferase [Chloroflexota bacterium]